jgi:tetratricopeptide (TPR) repeat protein
MNGEAARISGVERPTGRVQPEDEHARLALKALEEGRLDDARAHVDRIASRPAGNRAWRAFLEGRLSEAMEEGSAALRSYLCAAGWAAAAVAGGLSANDASGVQRLAAAAMEQAGTLHRRQEEFDPAAALHAAAYRLREEYGSHAERWESACGLGLDFHLAGRSQEAENWFLRAIRHAEACGADRTENLAVAWGHCRAARTAGGRHAEAVEAARESFARWRDCKPGELESVRAVARLAHALMRFGESLHDRDAAQASHVLDEALTLFAEARADFAAFGGAALREATWCETQSDFARRLRDSLPDRPGPPREP